MPDFFVHPSQDPSTFSNIDVIKTEHFHLDLFVDFNNKSLYGNVTFTLRAIQDASYAVFDFQGLEIFKAWNTVSSVQTNMLNFEVYTPNPAISSCVVVYFTNRVIRGDTIEVTL